MERYKADKKVESIRGIIAERVENQRKADVNKVRKVFRDELRRLKDLEKEEKGLRKKLSPGYELFGETIGVESQYYNDDLIPAVDYCRRFKSTQKRPAKKSHEGNLKTLLHCSWRNSFDLQKKD
jgi:hypothetical protein